MDFFVIEEITEKEEPVTLTVQEEESFGEGLAICPVCGKRSLKVEDGCVTCINPKCGYSKCDH